MASLTLSLDSRSTKNDTQQIKMRISHKCSNSIIPTGIWVEPDYFTNASLYEPITAPANNYKSKNIQIAALVMSYNRAIVELEDSGRIESMDANNIREYVSGVKPKPKAKPVSPQPAKEQIVADTNFLELLYQYGDSRPNENMRRHYRYVWNLLYQYTDQKKMHGINLHDINYQLLCDIKNWLYTTGRGDATRYKVESYMRTVYREAERLRLISRDASPYFDYKIAPVPVGDIDVLEVDDIRKMLSADLTKHKGLDRARDILMASFYLCGANFIDLYNINKPNKGEVVFIRHKVERRCRRALHIKVENELNDIIKRNAGSNRLFDLSDRSSNYYTAQRRMNLRLSQLSDKIGVKVNFELMRRTWATIASQLDVPDRVIDKSMGHVDSSVKDKFYERYDWNRTATHNRRIIDYVLDGVVPNSVAI